MPKKSLRVAMSSCIPSSFLVDTKMKLSGTSRNPYLAGVLQYLTFTRPNIFYVVQQVCLFMHDPKTQHMIALKRIIRYIKGTSTHILHLSPSTVDKLFTYTNVDWGGCPDTCRSTFGYCVYLGENLVSCLLNNNRLFLVLVQKQGIVMLLMLFMNCVGFEVYY